MQEDTAGHRCRRPSLCQVVLENHTSVSMRMVQEDASRTVWVVVAVVIIVSFCVVEAIVAAV
jgi:hypothetical protein